MQPTANTKQHNENARKTGAVLWTIQALLALIFLFAGGMKLILPIADLTKGMPLPGLFLRFIGMCEVAGAIGVVLPGLLRIRQGLTPLASAGLVIIMMGATAVTMATGRAATAWVPLVVGLLSAAVSYGHWRSAAPGVVAAAPKPQMA